MEIKIFIINLKRRVDRMDMVKIQLRDFKYEVIEAIDGETLDLNSYEATPFIDWVDPLINRNLTKGEIATALSHIEVWKRVAESDEPCIVLEDDNELVGDIDLKFIKSTMFDCDLLYLGYKEMVPDLVVDMDPLIKPYYPYHASAYVITPEFARKLLSLNLHKNIIPVDEFLPILNNVDFDNHCLSKLNFIKNNFKHLQNNIFKALPSNILALKVPIFKQYPRVIMGTDIEGSPMLGSNYILLTVGTDDSKMLPLYASCSVYNTDIINLGKNVVWEGGDMTSPGGGQKINLVKEYLKTVSDNKIIIFCDGYDVMSFGSHEKAISKFREKNIDILFAAEKTCWPDPSLADKFISNDRFKCNYLNSGCYIGYAGALKKFLSNEIQNSEDDQLYMQNRFLSNKELLVQMDRRNEIFTCLNGNEEVISINFNRRLINTETGHDPIFLHGNGGKEQKDKFYNIFIEKFTSECIEFTSTKEKSIVSTDILQGTFLSKKSCDLIIKRVELANKWESLPYDKFPGQEVRIKKVDSVLYDALVREFERVIVPAAEQYWYPLQYYGIRDMFIIKYTMDGQTSLPCHHDASLFSGSIKLNEDYEGAELLYYRQKFSNANIPAGDIIIWPGQVTHGHECTPLTSGTKYSLTIWTSRFSGDVN